MLPRMLTMRKIRYGVNGMEVISDIIARFGISSCSSLSRSLDNGRAIRRIVCVVVHNLRASHDHIRSDAFLRGRAYSWITFQEFLIEAARRDTLGVNSQASYLYRACQLLM